MSGISSVKSLKVNPGNIVWAESTAVGIMDVSMPIADSTGSAIVWEHLPMQDMSWILRILFMGGSFGFWCSFLTWIFVVQICLSHSQHAFAPACRSGPKFTAS